VKNLIVQLMAERPGDWLTHLETEFKIDAVRDGDRVSLKYNMIESPMAGPIVQQCRGMVVDTARRAVLAWPYDKFWNHGEGAAARIDWSTARVQEKLDGSFMILYWDAGAWWVASSGHPTAGGEFAGARTFRDAFWQAARDLEVDLAFAEPGIVYMLELCDAPNRVVVRHDRPRLVRHGARAMASGVELARAQLETEQERPTSATSSARGCPAACCAHRSATISTHARLRQSRDRRHSAARGGSGRFTVARLSRRDLRAGPRVGAFGGVRPRAAVHRDLVLHREHRARVRRG
jgi:hypothetical protein